LPARRFDAILVDIDHWPSFFLDPRNAAFYRSAGLRSLVTHLRPGGMFALWSNELPDDSFTARLGDVFARARAERVTFRRTDFTQTVYLARAPAMLTPDADG
jgi:hypothetical protein